jgi:hypothetical protein
LEQARTLVRVAANTPAAVLTNTSGQALEFAADGPYTGVQIRLEGAFAYQFDMPALGIPPSAGLGLPILDVFQESRL